MTQLANLVFSAEYDHLRAVLIAARKDAGLSQDALAARLGRQKNFVTMFENGQRRLDILDFHDLVRAMGFEPIALADAVFQGFRQAAPAASHDSQQIEVRVS